MIRWTFAFDEGNLAIDVVDAEENSRIQSHIGDPDKLLYLPGAGKDAYINLRKVKVILREPIVHGAVVHEIPDGNHD